MSLSKDNPPDPLVASVMRTAAGAPASGCPDAELLGLYAEQELSSDERAPIDAHVPRCGRCQATLAAFVRSTPEPAAAPAGSGVLPLSRWAGRRWLVPVASATAVVAVAVWIGRGPSNEVAELARAGQSAIPAETPRTPEPFAPDVQKERDPAVSGAGTDALRAAPGTAARRQLPSSAAGPTETGRSELARRLDDAARPPPGPPADTAFRATSPAASPPAPPPLVGAATAPAQAAAAKAEAGAVREADAARAVEAVPPPAAATPRDERARQDTLAKAAAPREANAARLATETPMATLTGTVTYRTRDALPPGAVIEVRLLDVSRADAPADTLARTEIVTRGEQVPVPFTLRYAAGQIQPRRRYSVQATISVEGRAAWRTTTAYPVFVEGAATTRVDVVVNPVR